MKPIPRISISPLGPLACRPLLAMVASLVVIASLFAPGYGSAQVVVLENGDEAAAANLSSALAERGIANTTVRLHETLDGTAPPLVAGQGLWIGAHFDQCRADEATAIAAHLQSGGQFLLLGAPPFQRLLHPVGDRLVEESAYLEHILAPSIFLDMATRAATDFAISTDHPSATVTRSMVQADLPKIDGAMRETVFHARIPEMHTYTLFSNSVPGAKSANAKVGFWAKATPSTYMLAVECREADASRWIAKIDLAPEWRYYVLEPQDFKYYYNPAVTDRGGAGDFLKTENVSHVNFGLALTHVNIGPGPHEFWISSFGMGTNPDAKMRALPTLDSLYPKTQTYPIAPKSLEPAETYAGALSAALPVPATAWSSHWRPMGAGIYQNRRHRFVPVVTGYNADGTRCGTPAAILVNIAEHNQAVWGYVALEDDALLLSPPWLDVIARMARRMERNTFLRDGGSTKYTYDIRDVSIFLVGAQTAFLRIPPEEPGDARLSVRLFDETTTHVLADRLIAKATVGALSAIGRPPGTPTPPDAPWRVRAEFTVGDELVDAIEHDVGFDGPRESPRFVTAANRRFYRDGQPWRAFAISYVPSSLAAGTNRTELELNLESPTYDQAIVEADLGRIAALGFNAISLFIYQQSVTAGHLLDILRLARKHGLMVNLSMRPHRGALPATESVYQAIIPAFRLSEKDEIFAYDIAWEPRMGYAGNRAAHGPRWVDWVVRRYGSIALAHAEWGYAPPELAAFPSDQQLREDGAWRKAVIDYRRFVDEMLNSEYGKARRQIARLDPNHLVSFRQSEGANPLTDPASYFLDLRSVAEAMDFLSPEGYGIGSSDAGAATMAFAASYAQALAPGKPMLWAEFGRTVWSGDSFAPRDDLLQNQAHVYRRIYENAQSSRAAGVVAWWFPGGIRLDEDSDYGILHPDGTRRPVCDVIEAFAPILKAPPPPVAWTPRLQANRDASVHGYAGIYNALRAPFFDAITESTIPLVDSFPERTRVREGRYAVRIANHTPDAQTGDTGFDLGRNLIPVTPGQRLRLDFWLRAGDDRLNQIRQVAIQTFTGLNEEGWGIGFTGGARQLESYTATRAWMPYRFAYTVPEGVAYVGVAFRVLPGCSIVIDDVRLRDLDDGGRELLPNGGFESWPGEATEPPESWRFFAVSGASGTVQRIEETPPRRGVLLY